MKTLNAQGISDSGQGERTRGADIEPDDIQVGVENEIAGAPAEHPSKQDHEDVCSRESASGALSEGWGFVSWDGGGGW